MILVDTSVWIDLLSKKPQYRLKGEQLFEVAICPPVLQEVLQGIKDDLAHARLKESLLAVYFVGEHLSKDIFLSASEIYRMGRRQGLTIRSSSDCLIAAIAIKNKLPVWHNDRDFEIISKFTGLQTITTKKIF